jgi:hypothetical protein
LKLEFNENQGYHDEQDEEDEEEHKFVIREAIKRQFVSIGLVDAVVHVVCLSYVPVVEGCLLEFWRCWDVERLTLRAKLFFSGVDVTTFGAVLVYV